MSLTWSWTAVAFICGVFVGVSEIISRYRDEPLRATINRYGLAYVLVNGLVSVLAYGLLLRYPTQILASLAGDSLLTAWPPASAP